MAERAYPRSETVLISGLEGAENTEPATGLV